MSSPIFLVKEHVLESQYIREYARATLNSQEETLKLAIKQYIPVDNPNPKEGDITIIAAHANGYPKELYEPLWEELHARSKENGFKIRGIWIADIAQEGVSGVINEFSLGNDPSWFDHARDLLHMINHFRAEMPLPLMGVGHSFGGNMVTNLALIHPRLLSSLVLIDPVMSGLPAPMIPPTVAQLSAFRNDLWSSRAVAEEKFRTSRGFAAWDARVMDRWCQFGIRPTPTALYPKEPAGSVTLTTTKHQECFSFLRGTWEALSADGTTVINKKDVIDLGSEHLTRYPFYRPEDASTFKRLPELRPSVLYIFGETSNLSPPEARKAKMDVTGTGTGGSGGAKYGRVKEVLAKGQGHLVPMEAVALCADAAAKWLGSEKAIWQEEMDRYKEWTKLSLEEKTTLSAEWKKRIGGKYSVPKTKI